MNNNKILFKGVQIIALFLLLFSFSSCHGTVITKTKEETITKSFEIEASSEEELLEKINALPETIEKNGKIYVKIESSLDEKEEGITTVTYKEIETDDLVLLYWDSIYMFAKKYARYVFAGIIGIALLIFIVKLIKNRYLLWW